MAIRFTKIRNEPNSGSFWLVLGHFGGSMAHFGSFRVLVQPYDDYITKDIIIAYCFLLF